MTPELEAALEPIGWRTVQRVAPHIAAGLASVLTPDGGLFHPHGPSARQARDRHKKMMEAVAVVLNDLAETTDDQARHADWWVATPEELDAGPPERLAMARQALEAIEPGLEELGKYLEWEARLSPTGRPKNLAAYRVASALAEAYVIGLGTRPTYGRRADESGPSGDFVPVAARVFALLGLDVKDPVDPCEAACRELSDDRVAELLIWRTGRAWSRRSIFDLPR